MGIIVRRRQERAPPHSVERRGKEGENPDHLRARSSDSSGLGSTPDARLDVSCTLLDYIPLSSCLPGDRYGAPGVPSLYPLRHRLFFSSSLFSPRHLYYFATEPRTSLRGRVEETREERRRYISKHIDLWPVGRARQHAVSLLLTTKIPNEKPPDSL